MIHPLDPIHEDQIAFSKDQLTIVASQQGALDAVEDADDGDGADDGSDDGSAFKIKHGMRVWFLRADNRAESREWIDTIQYGDTGSITACLLIYLL
jgi:hypothetical protein